MSSYENEHRGPTPETVGRIAVALHFPEEFFYKAHSSDIPEDGVSFRARTKVAAYKKASALAGAALGIEVSDWIDSGFSTPDPDLPSLTRFSRAIGSGDSDADVESAADILRARWGLGSLPIRNMVHLLEAHGTRVFSLTGETTEVDAFSFWHDSRPFVFLNTMKSGERGRFDAAHELGHLVLHAERDIAKSRDIEREADRFASAFLMPEADVRAHIDPFASVDFILTAKRRWKVSAMALTYRLRELGLLSDWVYRETCINLSRRGYKSTEPDGIDREGSQLLSKVLASGPRAERLNQLVGHLAVTHEDVRNLIFGLVVTSVDGGGQGGSAPSGSLRLVQSGETN